MEAPTMLARARDLRDRAEADPSAVPTQAVVDLLYADEPRVRREAVAALLAVLRERPATGVAAVDRLAALLEDADEHAAPPPADGIAADGEGGTSSAASPPDDGEGGHSTGASSPTADGENGRSTGASSPAADSEDGRSTGASSPSDDRVESGAASDDVVAFRERIIRCLAHVARERPDAVHPVSGAVTDRLDDPASPLVPAATVCLAQLVADDPDPYLRHVWPVAELLGAGDGATRRHAAHVLADLAAAHPVAVAGVVPVLREHLDDDPAVATKVSAAIGRVAGERPEAVRLTVPELVSCLDHRTRPVRTNVAGALADVAGASPELVGEAVPSLVERFDDDAVTVRRNAVTAVLRVADERPVLAARARGGIIELLDDPDATVRRSACTTLGYMSDTLAIELLREVARTDPDASVRSSARWAVEHIS